MEDLDKLSKSGQGLWYGYKSKNNNPFEIIHENDEIGGIIFFNCNILKEDFFKLLEILEIKKIHSKKEYSIIKNISQNPLKDKYIEQMRIVSDFGIKYYFEQQPSKNKQTLELEEQMWNFIEEQKLLFGTNMGSEKFLKIYDFKWGDWELPHLAFGLFVENEYYKIYRIWSRIYLVTK